MFSVGMLIEGVRSVADENAEFFLIILRINHEEFHARLGRQLVADERFAFDVGGPGLGPNGFRLNDKRIAGNDLSPQFYFIQ